MNPIFLEAFRSGEYTPGVSLPCVPRPIFERRSKSAGGR